jgi:predicted MPP superfamily phosphohydrolase
MVMIADTHYGNIYNQKEAKKLVETINTIAPDIVLIP